MMSWGCSGQTLALAVLSAWSLASLITIVAWATSPDLKGAARCRGDLRAAAVQLEGQRAVWGGERSQLEGALQAEREARERAESRAAALTLGMERLNQSLEECRETEAALRQNVSLLLDEREQQRRQLANLSAHIAAQDELVAYLEHNATQALMAAAACERLRTAEQHQAAAARTQTEACRVHQDFLQRQLAVCKAPEADAPRTQQQGPPPSPTPSRAAPPTLWSPALLALVCGVLRLLN
ncbi:uncharacterized protein LOC115385282 [Salarias fasciatus]|uniref:Uncharacterized LOC115385282 n=1 Tax=Salarias fasciatus TaxID=181472 RepID=A0A672G594_SALFA|nr:uncharacterized protein LOC115385282 [Salarias fasciatus]